MGKYRQLFIIGNTKMSDEEKYVDVKIPAIGLEKNWDDPEYKIAHLLIENVLFTNNGWWIDGWPKDAISFHVGCNDVFAWACADGEDIRASEIDDLYEMWRKDPDWGAAAWCIKKRKQMPQEPVIKIFKDAGNWDLDELIKGE